MIHYDYTRQIGYILAFSFLFFRPVKNSFAFAFQPARRTTTQHNKSKNKNKNKNIINDTDHILPESHNPPDVHHKVVEVDIDLEKAHDFATHFGKYSYGEIEHMRNDLHEHQLQTIVPGGQSSDILFLERFIEDDLTSQLKSLRKCMPDPYLFRYPDHITTTVRKVQVQTEAALAPKKYPSVAAVVQTEIKEDEIKTKTSSNITPKAVVVDVVEENTSKFDLNSEQLLEEGVLESLAICESLKEGMTDPYLPDDIATTVSKDKTSISNTTLKDVVVDVVENTSKFDLNSELLEEGVLESLAICAMLGLLMTAPHVF